MKCSAKTFALALWLSASAAVAQEGTATAPTTSGPGAVANDPAYTYKTLRLTRLALDALLARPEQLLVLDVRRPDEITKNGGFPAYLSIQTRDVQRSLSFIPRDRLIVAVSNRAHRAGAVGDILAGLGFHVVGAIGALDYQDEGGVLTKIAPARAAAAGETLQQPAAPAAAKP